MDLPRRVALYARAPTDDQDCHLSVETQFIILREHASDLRSDVHKEYADTGPSAGDRPQLQEMLRDAADPDRPFDAVLACDDAPLSRTAEEYRACQPAQPGLGGGGDRHVNLPTTGRRPPRKSEDRRPYPSPGPGPVPAHVPRPGRR